MNFVHERTFIHIYTKNIKLLQDMTIFKVNGKTFYELSYIVNLAQIETHGNFIASDLCANSSWLPTFKAMFLIIISFIFVI